MDSKSIFRNLSGKIIIIIFIFCITLNAERIVIFPGVVGEPLIDSIITNYKSSSNLGYNQGRDTLYKIIDNHGDSLKCVYTEYTIYMDPSAPDPSQWAYDHGINCEHTWPQSMGAYGLARGDLHHLFPSEIYVNQERGNLPFGEIPDDSTDVWFRRGDTLQSIPDSLIDEYSELYYYQRFEVRENKKGDISRAMFYFYTMYKDQYLSVDPDTSFWMDQIDTLYRWHLDDAADSLEISRTYAIAEYQDSMVNPFIIDSTLIRRAYFEETGFDEIPCSDITLNCSKICMDDRIIMEYLVGEGYSGRLKLEIFDVSGRRLKKIVMIPSNTGNHSIEIDFKSKKLTPGIYILRLSDEIKYILGHKIVKLR